MIFAIVGYSGTGKSTLVKEILKMNKEIKELVLVTDRPMRNNEKEGKDYHFVTKDEYDNLLNKDVLATNEVIKVYKDVWRYGIFRKHIKGNKIFAGSPEQVNQLKDNNEKVISIYIEVPEEERLKRILKRKDNQHEKEIARRTIEDIEKYAKFLPDFRVENTADIKNVSSFINGLIKIFIE